MDPFTYTAGGVYNDPRVMGRRYALFASTDAIFSRDDGRYDGFKSYLSLSRPFTILDRNGDLGAMCSSNDSAVVRHSRTTTRV